MLSLDSLELVLSILYAAKQGWTLEKCGFDLGRQLNYPDPKVKTWGQHSVDTSYDKIREGAGYGPNTPSSPLTVADRNVHL